ncbi:MAG: OmpA family protein [Cyclobacteriaceae bacterium]
MKITDFTRTSFLVSLMLFGASFTMAQQHALIGHQEFLGYYNPSLIKSGNFAEVTFLHRTQWEGFGPTSNTLMFNHPFRFEAKTFAPKAIGAIVQYEDFSFLTRSNVQGFLSGVVTSYRGRTLSYGVNMGVQLTGLRLSEFGLTELIDPELSNVDEDVTVTNRLGFSYSTDAFEIGTAAGINDFNDISDLHSSASTVLHLRNPKYVLRPVLILRLSENFAPQIEGQARITYDHKLSFTAGYRENFGVIFQLGVALNNNKIKGSYGSELPSSGNNNLGLTHEILLSAQFETAASKKHTSDSTFKTKRDSLNRLRIDSIRTAKIDVLSEQQPEEEVVQQENDPELDEEDPNTDQVLNFQDIPVPEDVLDNTHVILGHIGFESGQDIIKPFAYEELERLANYLLHDHRHRIEIEGHTDDTGSDDHNFDLSRRRALAVFNFLISKGVDKARIVIVGYGDTRPLFPNISEKNRELNRRIEIVFHDR